MVTPFIQPIPDDWLKDPDKSEFMRALLLTLNELLRPEGSIAVSEATTEVVLTQQQKLDLIAVTQNVNLDTMESDTATSKDAIEGLQDGLPAYSISNDGTNRTLNADAAAGAISNPPTQAQIENLRDAQLASDDVQATLIRDLANKGLVSD